MNSRMRIFAGAAAVLLLGVSQWVLLACALFGCLGATIIFYAAPIAFAVKTPRNTLFLFAMAAVVALVPALDLALQMLQRSTVIGVQTSCDYDHDKWCDVPTPTPTDTVLICGGMALVLFATTFVALLLWKHVTFRPAATHAALFSAM